MWMRTALAVCVLLLLLSACMVGPEYRRPVAPETRWWSRTVTTLSSSAWGHPRRAGCRPSLNPRILTHPDTGNGQNAAIRAATVTE